MKTLRTYALVTLAALMLLPLHPLADQKVPLIGIIQIVEHAALDAAREGFLQALRDKGYEDGGKVRIDYRNAQGNADMLASIADHFIAEKASLVLAIATPSAQTMAGKTSTIPIIGTAITDYVAARLAKSNQEPGYNVSGTTDMNPIREQLDLLLRLVPQAKTIGLIYTSSEDNSQVQAKLAQEIIKEKGLGYTEVTVNNSNDVQQAMQTLAGQCQAIYIPTDNVLASAMPIVYEAAVAAKIPIVPGESGMTMAGGTATLGIDYYKLGYQSGQMALEVLGGADIAKMPIQAQTEFAYTVNQTMADAIGLKVPADLAAYAKLMEKK